MKLKQYLSTKKLKRMVSKVGNSTKHSQGKLNESFEDFDPETAVTKDDIYLVNNGDGLLKLKRSSRAVTRNDMTQSLVNHLPSTCQNSQDCQTDFSPVRAERRDFSSQTNLYDSSLHDYTTSYESLHSQSEDKQTLVAIKDNLVAVDLTNPTFCDLCNMQCTDCQCYWNYHSLPSNIQSHQQRQQLSQEIHYSSLPLSMTQSIYEDNTKPKTTSSQSCDKWRRSRIKTNPWLPLPLESRQITQRHTSNGKTRRENPRLSRFFSEVEEIMRAQCAIAEQEAANVPNADSTCGIGSIYKYYNHTTGSEDSLSSTNTATPENDSGLVLRSPSEGYKSAYGSSELNMADDESDFTDSRASSSSDLSVKNNEAVSCGTNVTGGLSPPSLQDFKASLNLSGSCKASSQASTNSKSSIRPSLVSSCSLTESMFTSMSSVKSEVLEDKVRKLCLSTSSLDEKMKLARMESQYIHF